MLIKWLKIKNWKVSVVNCLNIIFFICFMDHFNQIKCYIQLDVLTGMLPWFLSVHTGHEHYRSRRSSAELKDI